MGIKKTLPVVKISGPLSTGRHRLANYLASYFPRAAILSADVARACGQGNPATIAQLEWRHLLAGDHDPRQMFSGINNRDCHNALQQRFDYLARHVPGRTDLLIVIGEADVMNDVCIQQHRTGSTSTSSYTVAKIFLDAALESRTHRAAQLGFLGVTDSAETRKIITQHILDMRMRDFAVLNDSSTLGWHKMEADRASSTSELHQLALGKVMIGLEQAVAAGQIQRKPAIALK
jgi:hypothetical protein